VFDHAGGIGSHGLALMAREVASFSQPSLSFMAPSITARTHETPGFDR